LLYYGVMDQQKPKAAHSHHAQSNQDGFALPPIPDGDIIPPAFHHTGGDKQGWWSRFKHWVSTHRKTSITLLIVLILLLGSGGVALYFALKKPSVPGQNPVAKVQPASEPPKAKYYSPLTGREVADEGATHRSVTGIMIENSEWARPQSGLDDAGVVFEAIAEGGITRFAALYQDTAPKLIGPVRSVRPYYVDWMAAFDATIVHIGGSANALKEVRNGSYKDADQFFNPQYFWRATDRVAPHNVYTDFQKLDKLNADKGYVSSTFTGWPRKEDVPPTSPNASKINISISSAYFNVRYDFDKGCNCYDRYVGGEKQLDRESGQNAKPKVVIAMKIPTEIGFEDGYREQMTTIGNGAVYIFQDGTVTVGTWTKTGKKNQIQFKNDKGEEVKLNRGQTWISVTAPEKSVTWQ
jgi:hypothetical protein